jgi:serine/threonine protein kinase
MTDLERLRAGLADRYRVEDVLGQGGMATVYLAHDRKHDRRVAIKVLRPDLVSLVGVERFLREIQIEARLQHVNILPLYDSGEASGFVYYVMPFVEGESLRDRLVREKQLKVDEAMGIAREIADALGYAHSHGVIHRDVKPENILLSDGHAVLADFGIARAIDVAGGKRVTESGHSIGTPVYMSPEQATGEADLDGRTDIYSLACVLFEMLAGEPPFGGRTPKAIIAKHVMEPPPSLDVFRPAVPASTKAAIERALAKTPADRFQTTSQFMAAIRGPGEGDRGEDSPAGPAVREAATAVYGDGVGRSAWFISSSLGW